LLIHWVGFFAQATKQLSPTTALPYVMRPVAVCTWRLLSPVRSRSVVPLARISAAAALALLRADHQFDSLKKKVVDLASLLEELENIPMVAAEMPLILESQTDEYWQDITTPMLETVRRRLGAAAGKGELRLAAWVRSWS
jgi:hypothetical protein